MLFVIIACEVGFWVLLGAGLASRYLLRLRRISALLLIAAPLVDLVLLVATVLHLRSGATATWADGLAAAYIGVSVGWGHRMIRWADTRFAHRFAGGPPPPRPPRYGVAHARHERQGWYRHLLAFTVGSVLLLGGVALVGDLDRSGALLRWIPQWGIILVIDFLWSFSYTFWPRWPKGDTARAARDDTARAARDDTGVSSTPQR